MENNTMMNASKFYSYRLLSMPYAQAHVVFGVNDFSSVVEVTLVSYETPILKLSVPMGSTDGTLEVLYPVDCSRTTARHVYNFTKELIGSSLYYTCKDSGSGSEFELFDVQFALVEMFERYSRNGKRYIG